MNAPRGRANPLPSNPKLIAVKPIDVRLIENPIVIPCYDETCRLNRPASKASSGSARRSEPSTEIRTSRRS